MARPSPIASEPPGPDEPPPASIPSTLAEAKTIAATGDGIPLSQPATVTFIPGLTSADDSTLEITPTTVAADGAAAAWATVTLVEANGTPIPGHSVSFEVTGVSAQIALPDPPLTDDAGMLSAAIRSIEVGLATISAVDQTAGVTLTDSVQLEFVAGPADPDRSSVGVSPTTLRAAGVDAAAITA